MLADPTTEVMARLPGIVHGRRSHWGASAEHVLTLPGGRVTVAVPDLAQVDDLIRGAAPDIADTSFDEIVRFLHRAGRNWRDPDYPRRQLYIEQSVELLGRSEQAARDEADWIAVLLTVHTRHYDAVRTELGDERILDEWVAADDVFVRAFPRGLAVHVLAGNVPLSGVVSIIRAMLTKNRSVAKVSSADPITPLAFALSLMDVDPSHPVTRSLSVVHWPHSSAAGSAVLAAADVVCSWGGGAAMAATRASVGPQTVLSEFGPRRSLAVVGAGADIDRVADGLAHDVCAYDQRGCFSVRQVVAERAVAPALRLALERALEEHGELLPPGHLSDDAAARVVLSRHEEAFLGADVREGRSWAIVESAARVAEEHPLARTVHLHFVDSLEEVLDLVDGEVQTVVGAPWDRVVSLRDALARRGCDRIVEPGSANVLRSGGSHDGVYPLQSLVRIVSHERPSAHLGRSMLVQLDQTELLRHRRRATDLFL